MKVRCPECSSEFIVNDKYREKLNIRMRCGHCKEVFVWNSNIRSLKEEIKEAHQNVHPFFNLRGLLPHSHINLSGYWSYPAFIYSNHKEIYWLYLILGIVPYHEKKITGLFRPKASVITTPGSKAIVRIEDFRSATGPDPFKEYSWDGQPVGIYPHENVKGISAKELKEQEAELLLACNAESRHFKEGGTLSGNFCRQWIKLSHPVFAGFLKLLAPDFIKALEAGFIQQT